MALIVLAQMLAVTLECETYLKLAVRSRTRAWRDGGGPGLLQPSSNCERGGGGS
jgi:hypothetical protein